MTTGGARPAARAWRIDADEVSAAEHAILADVQ
ncbi:hypothetical protein JOF36_007449 [Pseudonocardia parietis]|uniref:Uncharacterized protein n=1 Tax=Pseudonocardia parietis TaxID=570936 RepID=A0ABS4W662_9PSEU|nr:hypothetical protein [Pseudonocardia parietis]